MSYSSSFVDEFLRQLESAHSTAARSPNAELPTYHFRDASDRELLVTHSQPLSFQLGTGASIFTDCLIPAIISARSEVILVTCFWARSNTLTALHDALAELAARRRALIRGDPAIPPLRIRICLSSRSLLQKLLHPQSRSGYVYPPSSWRSKLGLPEPDLLEAGGIQLQVKSLFFLPLSVMHAKFVIIDRQRAFVPSCNVSWESWLEGCVEITGDAVQALLSFYTRTWDSTLDFRQPLDTQIDEAPVFNARQAGLTLCPSTAQYRMSLPGSPVAVPTLVLPSSYHRNPRFRPLPWQKHPIAPSTPLNIALLQLFDQAQRSIYIQTPNFTCEPVIAALLDALQRGVDVIVVTNRNMMLLEQLLTAGTTTAWCIRSLVRRFRRLTAASGGRGSHGDGEAPRDIEAGPHHLGRLRVSYFRARSHASSGGRERRPLIATPSGGEEPVHSHLKLTLVDDEYTVLGSGNMDRASWYTSQELGILFRDRDFAARVKAGVDSVLEGRLDPVFESEVVPN
ncbi:hypothetical protein VTK56DRAFT_10164 [Thermocarpiscus australiensis]